MSDCLACDTIKDKSTKYQHLLLEDTTYLVSSKNLSKKIKDQYLLELLEKVKIEMLTCGCFIAECTDLS